VALAVSVSTTALPLPLPPDHMGPHVGKGKCAGFSQAVFLTFVLFFFDF
jgi:hypothetical protein